MSLDFYLQYEIDGNDVEVFSANITHNLGSMADEADIYHALWRPEDRSYIYGKDIIPVLEKGLERLKEDPKYFEQFNAENGWGTYEDFIPFVEEVLAACKKYPNAKIHVSR